MDIHPALEALEDRGHSICLPVIQTSTAPLLFKAWKVGSPLQKGHYAIEIPQENSELCTPDVILVPLVAFDRAGHRLGYGAGYYDRTIENLRNSAKKLQLIGVGYSAQMLEHIPAQAHDQKLDMIVTEKESIVL